jgi:lipoyl synthase
MPRARLPEWLRIETHGGEREYAEVRRRLAHGQLHTVCEEARCPNRAECWGAGTATLLLLGNVCTRGCRFCAVQTGDPGGVLDETEPERAAATAEALALDYVVLTSVDRDDVADGGAAIFARAARAIKARRPAARVEALIPDFGADPAALAVVLAAPFDVIGHNVEVVRRLSGAVRDRRASFERSLWVLRWVLEHDPRRITKSSLMLGLGETDEEVREALLALRAVSVDIVTLGQYLQPTSRQLPVVRFVTPEEFERWREEALAMGFADVVAGPQVRSSHRARESYHRAVGGLT